MSFPPPLPQAYAHGDCHHPRPLFDALDHGFCAVEADVYVVDGEILVGHDREDLVAGKTLDRLYLEPLRKLAHENRLPAPITLLVDLKDEGAAIYSALRERLPGYSDVLTAYANGQIRSGPITLLLSGDRPIEVVRAEERRWAFIDGRLPDLDDPSSIDPTLTSWVSDNFDKVSRWDGIGLMPEADLQRIVDLVKKAHLANVKLRFWATPELPNVWKTLLDAGVDLINTDDLNGLAHFLNKRAH